MDQEAVCLRVQRWEQKVIGSAGPEPTSGLSNGLGTHPEVECITGFVEDPSEISPCHATSIEALAGGSGHQGGMVSSELSEWLAF